LRASWALWADSIVFGQDADKSKQNKSGETEAALAALSCDKMLPTPCEKHESEIL